MSVEKTEAQKATPEDLLYLEINKMASEINSKLDAERPAREPSDHSRFNWASEYHHPCKKFLAHSRLDWKDRQQMDIDGRWRVEEGNDKEWAVKKWLGNIGFELTQSQRYFNTDDPGLEKFKHLKISGKIDGLIGVNSNLLLEPFRKFKELPVEIKSVSPHYWNSTETIEDLKKHSKFWIQKIPSQLNTYFMFKNWPGGFLILVTFGKKPRILPMLFDSELWEEDKRKIEDVNAYVEKKEYPPPMPFDTTVCGMCDFNHLCSPLKTTDYVEVPGINEIELQMYLDLKDQHKKYEEMKKELIGNMDKPGKYFGKSAFVGDIEIKTKKSTRKKYPGIPKELKKPYEEEYELIQTSIERVVK